MGAEEIARAQAEQMRLCQRVDAFLREVDLLICPTAPVPPFPIDQPTCEEIDGRRQETYIAWLALTYALTVAGVPVCALPCGLDPTGMPFGIQVAARRGADRFLLGAARAIERALAADPETVRPIPPAAGG